MHRPPPPAGAREIGYLVSLGPFNTFFIQYSTFNTFQYKSLSRQQGLHELAMRSHLTAQVHSQARSGLTHCLSAPPVLQFGQYKRITRDFTGVLTGKGCVPRRRPAWGRGPRAKRQDGCSSGWGARCTEGRQQEPARERDTLTPAPPSRTCRQQYGGSEIRPEATGYGAVMFAENILADRGESLKVRPGGGFPAAAMHPGLQTQTILVFPGPSANCWGPRTSQPRLNQLPPS